MRLSADLPGALILPIDPRLCRGIQRLGESRRHRKCAGSSFPHYLTWKGSGTGDSIDDACGSFDENPRDHIADRIDWYSAECPPGPARTSVKVQLFARHRSSQSNDRVADASTREREPRDRSWRRPRRGERDGRLLRLEGAG